MIAHHANHVLQAGRPCMDASRPQGTFQKIPYHPNPYQKQMCNSLVQAQNGHWDMLPCGMLYWSGAVILTRLTAERRPGKEGTRKSLSSKRMRHQNKNLLTSGLVPFRRRKRRVIVRRQTWDGSDLQFQILGSLLCMPCLESSATKGAIHR